LVCPICESREISDYVLIGRGGQPGSHPGEYPVRRCLRHGVEFADALPPPRADEHSKESLDRLYGFQNAPGTRYSEFMDRVEAVCGRANGRRLHDVGCGNGQLLLEARRRGWDIQGNDIVRGVRAVLEENGITFKEGTLTQIQLPPETCDVITSFCVLPHHLTDPTPDMLAVEQAMKPGGWLILQLPDNGLFRKGAKLVSRLFWPRRPSRLARFVLGNIYGPGGHQFGYTRDNLREYLRKCGLEVVKFQDYIGSPKYALARFQTAPSWKRIPIAATVYAVWGVSHAFGNPNHMMVFARKPSHRRSS
jgi:SAM-dependent methyltransferase